MENTQTQSTDAMLETEILSQLINDKKYLQVTLPHLKKEFFSESGKVIFNGLKDYYREYHKQPNMKELILSLHDRTKQEKELFKEGIKEVIASKEKIHSKQLLKQTEEFIKLKMYESSVITGADALGAHDQTKMMESYKQAEAAVKVSLQSDIGTAFDEVDNLDFSVKKGLMSDIPSLDNVLGTGFLPATLNVAMAPSGVGKTATLIAIACQFLRQGKDCVFVSLEQSEAEIYKRVYANLLDIDNNTIHTYTKESLKKLVVAMVPNIGKLQVKFYPAKSISPLGLEAFLEEVKDTKNLIAPVVFVDYLGLLRSDLMTNMDNTYSYVGSIAEEIRAVAATLDVIMFSPMQTNRSSYNNLESGSESISESLKVYHTADFVMMINQTPDMKKKSELQISVIKNRYSGRTESFTIGFDYSRFKFVDDYFLEGENITNQVLTDNVTGQNDQLDDMMEW